MKPEMNQTNANTAELGDVDPGSATMSITTTEESMRAAVKLENVHRAGQRLQAALNLRLAIKAQNGDELMPGERLDLWDALEAVNFLVERSGNDFAAARRALYQANEEAA